MSRRIGCLLVASVALAGCERTAAPRPVTAIAPLGIVVQGTFREIDLESVEKVDVTAQQIIVRGAAERDVVGTSNRAPSERRYPRQANLAWSDATADWEIQPNSSLLRHRESGTTIDLQIGRGFPPVFKASAIGDGAYVVVFAAGDWKVGPRPSVCGEVTIRGEALRHVSSRHASPGPQPN